MSYSPFMQKVLDKVGGPSALAKSLGITPAAVTNWTDVPPRHLLRISALTGIPADKIRPDLAADTVKRGKKQ